MDSVCITNNTSRSQWWRSKRLAFLIVWIGSFVFLKNKTTSQLRILEKRSTSVNFNNHLKNNPNPNPKLNENITIFFLILMIVGKIFRNLKNFSVEFAISWNFTKNITSRACNTMPLDTICFKHCFLQCFSRDILIPEDQPKKPITFFNKEKNEKQCLLN